MSDLFLTKISWKREASQVSSKNRYFTCTKKLYYFSRSLNNPYFHGCSYTFKTKVFQFLSYEFPAFYLLFMYFSPVEILVVISYFITAEKFRNTLKI